MITVDNFYLRKMILNEDTKYEFSNGYRVFTISNDEVEIEISGYNFTMDEGMGCYGPTITCDVKDILDLHVSVLLVCDEQMQVKIDRYFLKQIKHIVENQTEEYVNNYNDLYDDDEPDGCAQYHASIDN